MPATLNSFFSFLSAIILKRVGLKPASSSVFCVIKSQSNLDKTVFFRLLQAHSSLISDLICLMHCFARIYPSRAIVRAQAIPIFFKKTPAFAPDIQKTRRELREGLYRLIKIRLQGCRAFLLRPVFPPRI